MFTFMFNAFKKATETKSNNSNCLENNKKKRQMSALPLMKNFDQFNMDNNDKEGDAFDHDEA